MLDDLIQSRQESISTLPNDLQETISKGRYDIVMFAEQLLGMQVHEGQKRFLRNATAKINILNPANRYGKSVLIAIKHIHANFYKIGVGTGNMKAWLGQEYRTANIAPQSAMTEPVFTIMKQILTSSFSWEENGRVTKNECQIEWFYLSERTLNTPPYKLVFANNSSCEHRSLGADKGDSLQGKPYGYISYDEGGRSHHLQREVEDNILPRLFDWGGTLDLVSTPDMSSPSILYHFDLYQKGKHGNQGYYTQEGSIRENTFFPQEVIDKQYELYADKAIGPQVLEGKFVFAGENIFNIEDVHAAATDTLNDGERYQRGHNYIIGIDTAIGEDEMVYTVMKEPIEGCECCDNKFQIVRQMCAKGNSKSPQMHIHDFLDLVDSYNKEKNVNIILETWNGESARFYEDLPKDLQHITKCFGSWQPAGTPKSKRSNLRAVKKADILIALSKLLSSRELLIPKNNDDLINQLVIYREDDKKIPTDRVMSLSLASWMATEGKPKVKEAKVESVSW